MKTLSELLNEYEKLRRKTPAVIARKTGMTEKRYLAIKSGFERPLFDELQLIDWELDILSRDVKEYYGTYDIRFITENLSLADYYAREKVPQNVIPIEDDWKDSRKEKSTQNEESDYADLEKLKRVSNDVVLTRKNIPLIKYNKHNDKSRMSAFGRLLSLCRRIRNYSREYCANSIGRAVYTWNLFEAGELSPEATPKELARIFNADEEIFAEFLPENKILRIKNNSSLTIDEWILLGEIIKHKSKVAMAEERLKCSGGIFSKIITTIFNKEPALEFIMYYSIDNKNIFSKSTLFPNAHKYHMQKCIKACRKIPTDGYTLDLLAQQIGYCNRSRLFANLKRLEITMEELLDSDIPKPPKRSYYSAINK